MVDTVVIKVIVTSVEKLIVKRQIYLFLSFRNRKVHVYTRVLPLDFAVSVKGGAVFMLIDSVTCV